MQKYYLGLDMGTNSVGWAVTGPDYRLLRFKKKDMWGIREFDEAKTAVERRTHRTGRRRLQRSKVRLGLIKSYFADEIEKIDPEFFIRLENSKYFLEDKDEIVKSKNGIFDDQDFDDKDYYSKYKTVFHLRKELIENNDCHDVRLLYLAISNMFKHRGHFLNAGLGLGTDGRNFSDLFVEMCAIMSEQLDSSFDKDLNTAKLEQILGDYNFSRSKKSEIIIDEFGITSKVQKSIIKALCGLNVKLIEIFTKYDEIWDKDEKKIDFSFSAGNFDEKTVEIIEKIGQDDFSLIETMKEIYDKAALSNIMRGYEYLSFARVADYEKHKKDLKIFKRVISKYLKDEYDDIFRSEKDGSYSAYVNSNNSDNSKSRRNYKGRKREDFYATVKKLLKNITNIEDEDIRYILNEIDKENFLPKQLTSDNGVIPNQVHAKELIRILNNAEKNFAFLLNKDESGLTVSERIVKLFTFQIPYYVGPVSKDSNGWVVRKGDGPVFPWNIEEKIDMKQTSEKFISRMVRDCTYVSDAQVLPKASLMYERYSVLNEINTIKINEERIDLQLKQDIYNELFTKGKKVTVSNLFKYLNGRGLVDSVEQISGVKEAFNNSLTTYGRFLPIFGEKLKEDNYKNMCEDIVFWCTVYGDSKKFLKEQLMEHYADYLDENSIKRILGMKFKDWGNLSREFLELQGCNKSTGEVYSLLSAMWDNNLNLMELLNSDKFTFKDEMAKLQTNILKTLSEYTIEDLEEEYFSAPVKRMVWQTLSLIKEIEKIMGGAPDKIFIEMTRHDEEKGDKGRKASRKNQLTDLYKNIKSESAAWKKDMISKIEKYDETGSLRSKKLYLYFIQKGMDMYTGKPIDLDNLLSANSDYDIDHIYPRHFVKDDNINNNLVLASKVANADKSDIYPVKNSIYELMKDRWRMLRDEHLITEEKYKRLVCRSPFSEEQMAGFIARQLVETSQGTKGVADLLKQLMPEATTIVYSKATNVSEFRKKFKIAKSRIINDFHHANDAYLNIVVGNIFYTKFTQNPMNFIKKEYAEGEDYHLGRMYDWNIERNGEIAWLAERKGNPGTISIVKEMLAKNTPILTRLSFEAHGEIANATLYSHKKAKETAYIPVKTSDEKMQDVTKYGGLTSVSISHLFLVEHEVKGKKVRTLETVPIYLKAKFDSDKDYLLQYCKEDLKLINPVVRLARIKIQSLIKVNGYYMHISGKTNKQFKVRNAVSMCVEPYWINYVHKLEKYKETNNWDELINREDNIALYEIFMKKHLNSIFSKKPNSMGAKLEGKYSAFKELTIEKQVDILYEILKLTLIGITKADLSGLKEASECGVMLISKTVSGYNEFKLINQSITGLYENEIDLLTV